MPLTREVAPLLSYFMHSLQCTSSSNRHACVRFYRPVKHKFTRQSHIFRRGIVTANEYRPESLEIHPPPRNIGTPDTSIAGGKPGLDVPASDDSSRLGQVSIPEGEAQKSRAPGQGLATENVASLTQVPKAQTPPRKSKLRARKAAMSLSPAAVEALKELLSQPEPKLIRVGVKNRGCSGLAYHLEYVEKPGAFDEAVDQDGVKVLIDSKALFSIIGSEMDWVEDKLSRRFVFKNPNITEQCGCGESFSIS